MWIFGPLIVVAIIVAIVYFALTLHAMSVTLVEMNEKLSQTNQSLREANAKLVQTNQKLQVSLVQGASGSARLLQTNDALAITNARLTVMGHDIHELTARISHAHLLRL